MPASFGLAIDDYATTTTGHSSGASTLALASGSGAALGSLPAGRVYRVTALSGSGTAQEAILSILEATGRSGDTLTGVHASTGYTDVDLPAGTAIEIRMTSKHLSEVQAALDTLLPGGYRTMADHAARNGLATSLRVEGMLVYTQSDQITYQLLPAPWNGDDADWSTFSALNPYAVPTFLGFGISGVGATKVAGDSISGTVSFLWTTTNPTNVAANSISIQDVTNSVTLASGLADDGNQSIALPTTITHAAGESHTWQIIGTDSKGNSFSATFTVSWVAASDKVYYVRTDGSDSNNGLANNSSGAWLTTQHAADTVLVGDTVHVGSGTFAGFSLGWDAPQSGAQGHPITFDGGGVATLNHRNVHTFDVIDAEDCSFLTITGFTIANDGTATRAGIRISGTGSGNSITNNTVTGTGRFGIITGFQTNFLISGNTVSGILGSGGQNTGHGIYSANAGDYGTISGNTCSGNAGDGIHTNGDASQGGAGVQTNLTIRKNTLSGNNTLYGGAAINSDGIVSSRIENNLIYAENSAGIALYAIDASAGSTNNVVCNNTVLLGSGSVKHCLRLANASINNTVFNNILWSDNAGGCAIAIDSDCLTGLVSDYNLGVSRYSTDSGSTILTLALWRTSTALDANSLVMASKAAVFTAPGSNDYTLLSSGPAVNAGVATLNGKAGPTDDLAGNSRPFASLDDAGCYESHTVTVGVTAVTPTDTSSGVDVGTTVTFTFDRAVDESTIVFGLNSGGSVPGTLTYDSGTHTATFTPTSPLAGATTYSATISAVTGLDSITLASPYTWSFTTLGAHRIWGDSYTPATIDSGDGTDLTLGVLFKSDVDASLTKVKFYKDVANTGTHVAKVWSLAGSLLATKTFSGESASGWQSATLDTPVALSAGVRVWASVRMPVGHYSDDGAGTTNGYAAGIDHAPLHVNQGGSGFGSGFATGDAWPDANHSNVNYWIDVEVQS